MPMARGGFKILEGGGAFVGECEDVSLPLVPGAKTRRRSGGQVLQKRVIFCKLYYN